MTLFGAQRRSIKALPVQTTQEDDDGNFIVWHDVPFPNRRKKSISRQQMLETSRVTKVPITKIYASQYIVTQHGVERFLRHGSAGSDYLPYLEAAPDGTYTIHDGHHRVTAAYLKGHKTVRARVFTLNLQE